MYNLDLPTLEAAEDLARDLWPDSLPRLSTEKRLYAEMPDRQKVPGDFLDAIEWAQVQTNANDRDCGRRYVLALAKPGPNGRTAQTEVVFHLQGFIKAEKCDVFGTWNPKYVSLVSLS